MLIGEPPPTQADLHFRLFGFPVRIHPFFWVVALLLGIHGDTADPVNTLLWVAVVFVSILVHELGHAVMQRHYGGRPWITLYGMGGLASCDDCDRSTSSQIVISLAGPVAGFLLAVCVVMLLAVSGHFDGLRPSVIPIDWTPFDLEYARQHGKLSARDTIVWDLLAVNIFWGLLNLLPIYPLDGGQISRELMTHYSPRQGIVQSLWLSAAVAVAVAVFGLSRGAIFMALLFGYLAYSNYQTLRAYQQSW